MTPKPHQPKLQRLPKGKRMTIALGILGGSGIVVGADTEETVGDAKTEMLKVSTGIGIGLHGGHPSAMAITGAGDSWYLDYIFEELTSFFQSHENQDIGELNLSFRQLWKEFYKEHVAPFLANEPDLGLIRLVIGAQRNNQAALWVSARNTLRQCHGYEAVGLGDIEAKSILSRAISSSHSLELIATIACYAIKRAKERVVGCGKNTVLLYLVNNSVYHVYPDTIEKAEKLFRKYEGHEYSSFMYALGHQFRDESKHLDKMRAWSQDLREEFKQLTAQMLADRQ